MTVRRCHLVHALAPPQLPARAANDLLNAYVADESRGIAVWHDRFVGRPHGGAVVLDITGGDQLARLHDPGPLAGWAIDAHPLTFSLTGVGFGAQAELTLEEYRDTSFEQLAESEPDDPRHWWKRRNR